MGRNLKDHNPYPRLEEDVTPKKIALALSIDLQDVLSNWDTKGTLKVFANKFLEDLALNFEKAEN